jgi:hypothetical protein
MPDDIHERTNTQAFRSGIEFPAEIGKTRDGIRRGCGWVDPFSGMANFFPVINPEMPLDSLL